MQRQRLPSSAVRTSESLGRIESYSPRRQPSMQRIAKSACVSEIVNSDWLPNGECGPISVKRFGMPGMATEEDPLAALGKEPDVYLLRFANVLAAATKQHRLLEAGLAVRGIRYAPGAEPPAPLPFPEPLPSGTTVQGAVDSRGSRRSNLWRSSAHFWFVVPEAADATITLKIVDARDPEHADLDIYLYDGDGESVAHSNAVNGVGDTERISRRLEPGYYRVEVRSWSNSNGSRLSDRTAHQGTFTLLARY